MLHIINITNDKQQQQQQPQQQQHQHQHQQHQNHEKNQGSLILIVFNPLFNYFLNILHEKFKHIKVKKCLFIIFHFSASE